MKNEFCAASLGYAVNTPAFVCDETALAFSCERVRALCRDAKIRQFFPLKCHNLFGSLQIIGDYIDGFAASSLFEAQLAREILGDVKKVHFTSPGLRDDELEALLSLCDGISFNSLSQWARFKDQLSGHVTSGLRINPQLSFVKDTRYNPCRPHSRLGAPLEKIKQALASQPELLQGIEGIHFHTNCDATDWSPLKKTVQHLDTHIPHLLRQCRWINLGGGYLLEENTDLSAFRDAVQLLQNKYELEVIIELGAGIVRDTCFLVAQVVDLFESDGMQIVVLDTTVNHMPEVFEYQFNPDVVGDTNEGRYSYILTGATCLAGDVFGEYAFDTPLAVGSRVIFTSVGAYTLVKSHMFNGVNLPTIYALSPAGELKLQKQHNYEDFRHTWGPEKHDKSVRNVIENSQGRRKRRTA
jgi:carboxynorspermidine decarboxylase